MVRITYNKTVIFCDEDGDCPSNSVCVYASYEQSVSNVTGRCGCNPEIELGGDLCNEISSVGYNRVFLLCLFAFITFIFGIFALIEIHDLQKNGSLRKLDVKVATISESFIGLVSLFLLHLSGIRVYYLPLDVSIHKFSNGGKITSLAPIRNVYTACASFFAAAGVINVGILWLQVAIASKRFKNITNPKLSSRYVFIVLGIDIFMIITMAICYYLDPSLASEATTPFVWIVRLLYCYSVVQISKVMKITTSMNGNNSAQVIDISMRSQPMSSLIGISEKDKRILEALRKIQISALWIVSTYLIVTILLTLSSILGSKLERVYHPPESYYIPSLLSDIAYLILSFAISSVVWYIHHHTHIRQSGFNNETSSSNSTRVTLSLISTNPDTNGNTQPTSSSASYSL